MNTADFVPRRVQRKRTKGWRMPENTVSVCRPGRWGNPFKVGIDGTAQGCVDKFREYIGHPNSPHEFEYEELEQLRGKNLACYCKEGTPCHADVLLELANKQVLNGRYNRKLMGDNR